MIHMKKISMLAVILVLGLITQVASVKGAVNDVSQHTAQYVMPDNEMAVVVGGWNVSNDVIINLNMNVMFNGTLPADSWIGMIAQPGDNVTVTGDQELELTVGNTTVYNTVIVTVTQIQNNNQTVIVEVEVPVNVGDDESDFRVNVFDWKRVWPLWVAIFGLIVIALIWRVGEKVGDERVNAKNARAVKEITTSKF